ncbi:MAG: FG-GAP repeat protein, partial [Bacteroidales bacterium]|nr:FG-GAP repeat protein [Bacteroidales bacterium]
MKNFIVFFIVFVCCAFTNNLLCQTPVINEDFTLIANDGASYDHYGTCVSVFSSIAVVGSPDDNNSTGAAYVYIFNNQTNTWEFEVKLTASDGVQGDEFGRQVCIYKDYIIVGAHLHSHNGNSEAGKAYIYNPYGFGNWSEQILTASNASSGDHFGRAVSIYGNYAIVGAKDKNNGRGSAYIFRKGINGFYQTQIIDPSNLDVNDNFGQAVSINDNYAIISAMYDDGINNSNTNCGCAYIYKFDVFSWVYVSKLYASDCSANDWFGNAVSIDRKSPTVVIGSMMENSHGSAYVFA